MKGFRRLIRAAWLALLTMRALRQNSIDARAYMTYLSNLCGVRLIGVVGELNIPALKEATRTLFLTVAYSLCCAKRRASIEGKNTDEAIQREWIRQIATYRSREGNIKVATGNNPLFDSFPLPSVMLEEHRDIVFQVAERMPLALTEAQTAFAVQGWPETRITPDEFYMLCRALWAESQHRSLQRSSTVD